MSHVLTGVDIEDRYGDPQSTEDPFNALADCEDALKAHSLRAKRGLRDPDASQRTQRTALKHTAAVMELAQLRDAYEKRAAHVEKRDRALIEKRRQEADKVSPIVKEERAMPLYDSVARVTREERTYSKQKQERPISDGGVSFFADLREAALGDAGAQLRLQRNAMEAETENRAATQSSSGANSYWSSDRQPVHVPTAAGLRQQSDYPAWNDWCVSCRAGLGRFGCICDR